MTHIIDVLRGAKKERIQQYGHHELSTYGIGKDKSADEWKSLARSLLHQGLIDETADGYRVLKLNRRSWEVMRSQTKVSIAVLNPQTAETMDSRDRRLADVEMLLQRLRSLRKSVADAQGVPPYIVFADSTLRLMAQQQPQTLEEFRQLSGVGDYKLVQYGHQFVAEIRAYCQEQENLNHSTPSTATAKSTSATLITTLKLHQQGLTPEEIAQKRNLNPSTILHHLSDLIEMNQPVNLNQLVPPERQSEILQGITAVGDRALKPIYDYLEERYSYEEIKLVRGWWRCQNNQ